MLRYLLHVTFSTRHWKRINCVINVKAMNKAYRWQVSTCDACAVVWRYTPQELCLARQYKFHFNSNVRGAFYSWLLRLSWNEIYIAVTQASNAPRNFSNVFDLFSTLLDRTLVSTHRVYSFQMRVSPCCSACSISRGPKLCRLGSRSVTSNLGESHPPFKPACFVIYFGLYISFDSLLCTLYTLETLSRILRKPKR